MELASILQNQNVTYMILIVALWTLILATVVPGTGAFEAVAGVGLFISIVAVFLEPVNVWALPLIFLGVIAFFLELRINTRGIFLLVAIVLATVGSAFLFRGQNGESAGVSWWIAAIGSLLTAGFFWLAFSTYLHSGRSVVDFSADKVVGQVGTAKTDISMQQGMVQVASALWSARSDSPIPSGSRVRIHSRHGLVLTVQKED
ncbi:MAG: NfeD family protein [Anaerolineales bacterium]|jgi:membrane-bound ClpP family serine protease